LVGCAGYAAALGLAGLLAGCAETPTAGPAAAAAVTPASAPAGPSARLLLRGAAPEGDRYAVFQLADALQCKGPRLLADGDTKKPPTAASLPAGVLTTLDFVILRGGRATCGMRWSFTPVAGRTYLVQGFVVGTGCTARLLDASQPDRPVAPPDAVQRNGPGQACLPLDQARANRAAAASPIQGGQQDGEAVLNPQATPRDLQGLIAP